MRDALHEFLDESVERVPKRIAVEDPSGTQIRYEELGRLTGLLSEKLRHMGIGPGDRVAFYLHKSIDSIISLYGILKSGAAYVPLDPSAPASRNAYILDNCSVAALILEDGFVESLSAEFDGLAEKVPLIVLHERNEVPRLASALDSVRTPVQNSYRSNPDDLAYILYTSGSTGHPKGVMLTHRNAISFVDWCSEVFEPTEFDRCSSHAPLHFDLSILDIHLSMKHGTTLVLIGEEIGKSPDKLAKLIADRKISIWYSTPSILSLMAEFGKMERHDYSALRQVLFAGEVFPVKHLRTLTKLLPKPRYFNLYGPTETNVCTYYEIPAEIPDDRTSPFPIGKACSHYSALVIDDKGKAVKRGEEGELVMHGPAVTPGYWKLPEQSSAAYHTDASGRSWYKTGDIVIEEPDGNFTFLGRRDRMIKKRGYRIELGEIETCLYSNTEIDEVGVISMTDTDDGTKIFAFVSPKGDGKLSVISLRAFCAKNLPGYMIPDRIVVLERLPRTSTNKVDYQQLKKLAV